MLFGNWTAAILAALAISLGGLTWVIRNMLGRRRSERMESYLRLERQKGAGRGERSIQQIMVALGMTAGEVRDAARRSPAIKQLAMVGRFPEKDSAVFEYAPFGAQGRDAV